MRALVAFVVGLALGALLGASDPREVERRRSWGCDREGQLLEIRIEGEDFAAVCRVRDGRGTAVVGLR